MATQRSRKLENSVLDYTTNRDTESESETLLENDDPDRKILRLDRKIAYATGNFITVLAISMWFPYNIIFFQKVVGLTPQNAGYIVLFGQIGGAVSTPFIGTWSDQCRCKVPGRRKIFHLTGVLCVSVVFFFLWHSCFGCSGPGVPQSYQVLYFSCFAIVFQYGWASTQLGQLALLPELCKEKKSQVELNSMRYTFTIVANMFIFGCFWGLLEVYSSGTSSTVDSKDADVFMIIAAIVLAIGVPSSLVFQCLIPEKPDQKLKTLKWYKWLMNPKFYLTALCLVASRYIALLPQTYISFYFTDTLHMDKTSVAKGPLFLYISSFLSTLVIKRCRNFIGDKMTYFLGLAVVWGSLIFFWVKEPTDDSSSHFNWSRDCIYIALILLGAGGAVVVVIALSMIAFLVNDYKGSSAFVYGWILCCDRLSNGIGVKIIQSFIPQTDDVDNAALGEFYRHVLVFTPFAASALGILVMLLLILIEKIQEWRDRNTEGDRRFRASTNIQGEPREIDYHTIFDSYSYEP